VGRYTYATAIAAPISILFGLGLRNVIATDMAREYSFTAYHKIRSVSPFLAAITAIVGALIIPQSLAVAVTCAAIMIAKYAELQIDLAQGVRYRDGCISSASRSMVVKSFLGILFFFVVYYFYRSLDFAILAMAGGWLATYIFLDRKVILNEMDGDSKTESVLPLVKTCVPLGVALALMSMITNIPRIFLEEVGGSEALGVFALLAYLVTAGGLVFNSIGQVLSPILAGLLRGPKGVEKFLLVYVGALISIVILAVISFGISEAVGQDILSLLYGSKSAAHLQPHLWKIIIIAGLVYAVTVTNSGINAIRSFGSYLPATVVIAVIAVILSWQIIRGDSPSEVYVVWGIIALSQFIASLIIIFWGLTREANVVK